MLKTKIMSGMSSITGQISVSGITRPSWAHCEFTLSGQFAVKKCSTGLPPSINDPNDSDSDVEIEDEADEDSNGVCRVSGSDRDSCLPYSGGIFRE